MQISDLLGQYHNSLNAGSKIANGTRGVGQVADTVNKLGTGQLFEGTVTGMKGEQVTLSLSNGQSINARLAGDVGLIKGESVFFEVKSNDGNVINIRPVSMGTMNNPTLLSALDAAGLPVSEDSLSMVKEMMSEQMPIDAQALSNMAKLQSRYPDTDVATLVTMKKLGMEISPEMIEQFEHYQANEGAILDAVSDLAEAFTETLANPLVTAEDIKDFQEKLMQVLNPEQVEGTPEEGETQETENAEGPAGELLGLHEGEEPSASDAKGTKTAQLYVAEDAPEALNEKGMTEAPQEKTEGLPEKSAAISQEAGTPEAAESKAALKAEGFVIPSDPEGAAENPEAAAANGKTETAETQIRILSAAEDPEISKLVSDAGEASEKEYPPESVGRALNEEQLDKLNQTLKETGILPKLSEFTGEGGKLSPKADIRELMSAISGEIQENPNLSKEELTKILSSEGYKGILRSALTNKWTLAPEELADKDNIKKLYEDLEKDVAKLAQAANDMTKGDNPLSQSARQVHNNIEFMNQVNETYTYIQLPLKLAGGQASGDLYVYSNKKRSMGDNDEISAFLHFDLEHLGSTDISVKMRNKKVDTKFFMDDDVSFDLIGKNLPVLQAKLEKLGYNVSLSVDGGREPVNFVEDFLKQDAAGVGTITRYSFDMRA